MTDTGSHDPLAAEQRVRVLIDAQLEAAGWSVQSQPINLHAGQGVAVREVAMAAGHGRAHDEHRTPLPTKSRR